MAWVSRGNTAVIVVVMVLSRAVGWAMPRGGMRARTAARMAIRSRGSKRTRRESSLPSLEHAHVCDSQPTVSNVEASAISRHLPPAMGDDMEYVTVAHVQRLAEQQRR